MKRAFKPGIIAPALVCLLSAAHAQEARVWLERMNRAVEDLSYQGTFVHVLDGKAETLHVIHRNQDGEIAERLFSMDGAGREIIRRQDSVQCILPDRKVVLLEETKDASPLVSALPNYSEQLEANYRFKLYSTARVLNRETQVIGITPKDDLRYGYVLWLDSETYMPLKSKLLGDDFEVVEQILFTAIEFPESIPVEALDPTIDTGGFKLFTPPRLMQIVEGIPWLVTELPPGFQLTVASNRPIAGSPYPVGHLVFSDGLASVSVFIEDPKTDAQVSEGFSRMGSTNAFSLVLGDRMVTAVGEVPRRTVRQIATSVQAQ